MMNDPLLHRYVTERSEAAFAELVRQHIDLVYSAALRQVNGDATAAQDVTQAVFTDLASKAPRLLGHTSLTGWLYTSTRYLAAKTRRSEQRRVAREQEAYAMNQLLQSTASEPVWQELRPVLDEAMHDLNADDREAVLLRFFERRSLGEIGTRLGLTEEAARKRVARAVDKLRAGLARRGITSTVAALSVALAERTVSAAPAGMAAQVSRAAFAAAAATGGLTWALLKLAGLMKGNALVAAGATVLVAGVIVVPKWLPTRTTATSAASSANVPALTASAAGESNAANSAPAAATGTTIGFTLHIVADDTGKPIAGAKIECLTGYLTGLRGAGAMLGEREFTMTATDQGVCKVPVPRNQAGFFTIRSRTDGFGDMEFQWGPRRADGVPQEYTMRLARATPVGGKVVNEQGQPVAGAKVTIDCRSFGGGGAGRGPILVSPRISTAAWEEAVTDVNGAWRINRFARENVGKLVVWATHEDYATNDEMIRGYVGVGGQREAEQQFLAGTYIYKLDRGITVQGIVRDPEGQPVSGANVAIRADTRTRETTNQPDGRFTLTACKVGAAKINAQAQGYAPLTLSMNITNNQTPLLLRLNRAKPLRLRLVNIKGSPVTNANVMMLNIGHAPFDQKSDAEGRITWDSAPQGDLYFDIRAAGYASQENVRLKADGEEHRITLHSARTISGSVRDAATRLPVSNFRIASGELDWTNVSWQTSRGFESGSFRYVDATPGSGSKFKFEADGYAPFVTRIVGPDEGEVSFDIALYPASATTITVVSPDGKPATNASIGLQIPGTFLNLMPGGFTATWQARGLGAYTNVFSTDQTGRFDLPQDDSITSVIAACPAGYVEATPATLAGDATMRLKPWGRLEGTLLSGGKPVVGRTLNLAPGPGWTISYVFETGTDENGHFAFTNVPPRQWYLFLFELPSPLKNSVEGSSARGQAVTVRSGETTTVSLPLYPVMARLGWPAGVDRQADWRVKGSIELIPLPGELPDERPLQETEDGTWKAEDMPVGNYTVRFNVFSPTPESEEGTLFWRAELPLVITADLPGGVVDAGELMPQPVP